MNPEIDPFRSLLNAAQSALQRGDRREARRLAQQVVASQPERAEGWMILAATSSPKASISYLKRALEINPGSQRARQGMHWAIQRLRQSPEPARGLPPLQPQLELPPRRSRLPETIATEAMVRSRPMLAPWIVIAVAVLAGLSIWFGSPTFSLASNNGRHHALVRLPYQKLTRTPTPTATFTPTLTPTSTSTPTITPSPTPTETPSPTPTETPKPAKKSKKAKGGNYTYPGRPAGVDQDEGWVDVDLSQQRVYVYEGDTLLNKFVVSTGTSRHPTVTGTFKVYVKYRAADMSGPGYYLPKVPYVMYFYKDYGLHGTYWHRNFGTPMSHGCINLKTDEAGWLFNFASVGTVVNIHR